MFLGYKLVVAEYAVGVFFSTALGLLVLYRGHSFWQLVLGIYLISLGINYIPMLAYTLSIAGKESALAELSTELADKAGAMSKYRRQSIFLLVPLAAPILALAHRKTDEMHQPPSAIALLLTAKKTPGQFFPRYSLKTNGGSFPTCCRKHLF